MSNLSGWTTRDIVIDLEKNAENFVLDEMFFVACADSTSRLWQKETYTCDEQWLLAMKFFAMSKYSPEWMKKNARRAIKSHKEILSSSKISLGVERSGRKLDYAMGRHDGYVYLFGGDSYYKIGLSKDPACRIDNIATKLPFKIETLCIIKTNDTRRLEGDLHKKYGSKRLNGEWFRLNDCDIEEIKRMGNETILET